MIIPLKWLPYLLVLAGIGCCCGEEVLLGCVFIAVGAIGIWISRS